MAKCKNYWKMENNNLATVNAQSNPYLLALKSKQYAELTEKEALMFLNNLLTTAYTISGQKMSDDIDEAAQILLANCRLLHLELKRYFPKLKKDEIELAFSKGVRGKYGEYYGLNIKTYNAWLESFKQDKERISALKEISQKAQELEENSLKAAKKDIIDYWNKVKRDFLEFKSTGKIKIQMPLSFYRTLWDRGLIKTTAEQKSAYMSKAVEYIKQEAEMLSKPVSKQEKDRGRALKSLLEKMEQQKASSEQQNILLSKGAELAVIDFYKQVDTVYFCEKLDEVIKSIQDGN